MAAESEPIFRLSRREAKWLAAGSLAFAAIYFYPVLCDYGYLGPGFAGWLNRWPDRSHFTTVPTNGDRDMFSELRWVPYFTLTHFRQLPLWNPYKCGGMPMLANPETAIVTPFIVLYLALGLVPGILAEIYFHLAIMFAGGYVLGRELGLRTIACVALAAMFPSSSWLSLHVAAGHLNFLSTAYTPWIIALLYAAGRTRRWFPAAVGGLLCALTVTEGNYALVYAAMLVGIAAIVLAASRLSVRPLAAAALIGIFGIALAALKLIPAAELLAINPREFGISYLRLHGALVSIFSRDQDLFHEMTGPFFFSEYGGYIGAPFAALAVLGILTGGRNAIAWTLGAVLFFALYLGDLGPHMPSVYLRYIPLAKNMGLSGRWVIPLVFCAGVLAALGADYLCRRRGAWGPQLAATLVTIGMIDAWLVCAPNYRYLVQPPLPGPPPSATFRQYYIDNPIVMTFIGQANMGSAYCGGYGYVYPRGNVKGYNEAGYRGEYFIAGAGEVRQVEWTPNRMSYEVNVPAPAALVINQNYYPGWRIARGSGDVYSEDRLLAVRIPAGRQEIELVFQPTHIGAALGITIVAALGVIAIWWRETRAA